MQLQFSCYLQLLCPLTEKALLALVTAHLSISSCFEYLQVIIVVVLLDLRSPRMRALSLSS